MPTVIWYPPEPIERDPIQGVQFDRQAKRDIVGAKLKSIVFDDEAALKQL